MSTLAEIETAVAALPPQEQELLLRHLEMKFYGSSSTTARLVMENGRPVLAAPPGAPEMTSAMVKAALADFP